jgi:hypothetical protein
MRPTPAVRQRPRLSARACSFNNEYGIGQAEYFQGFNRYTKGLMATEFLMEHFIGNWFSACFYDMAFQSDRGLLDGQNGYRFNPAHFGIEMLANAQGGTFLNVTTGDKLVHGFAALKNDAYLLYLLNKTLDERPVQVRIEGDSRRSAFGRLMRNSEDHYGALAPLDARGGGSDFDIVLPPLTFGQMAFVNGSANPLRDPETAGE